MKNFCLELFCRVFGAAGGALLSATAICLLMSAAPAQAQIAPSSGYWWNATTPGGSGFVIEVQGNEMFMAGFLYAANGEASWVASYGPMTSSSQYSGSLITDSGGQTLTGAYMGAPKTTTTLGTISINFSSNNQATITWPGGTIPIQRFDFGPGGSAAVQPLGTPEPGWWWNPNEGGRGFAVEIQGNAMYFAGYMYDNSGNPTWYLASGNMSNPTVFQGNWAQYANGQTLTGPYKAPSVVNSNVGSAVLVFTDNHTATLTLPDGRDIPFTRYAFGIQTPTLSAFSPASAAPAATLTLTGTGFVPTAEIVVTLSNSNGNYTVSLPPSSVTAGTVNISVPPFVNSFNNNFASGTVNLVASQKANGITLNTNTLSGFTIQSLNSAASAGNATLALISASLSEAQRLQTAIQGTPQGTPAVAAAIATQVANLQALVTGVQNVLQLGESFELGVVGGVDITVDAVNIVDVDQLILATLQALAAPAGSAEKTIEAGGGSACLAAEATAYAAAITSGANLATLNQLALNLVRAANSSSACNTVDAFASAYQVVGGASGTGYGFTNGAGIATLSKRLAGAALFATALQTAQPQLGLNALTSTALGGQGTSVQNAILNVATLGTPVTNQFINQATGVLITSIIGAQNLLTAVAPPPPGAANPSMTGTWTGTWSWIAGANACVFNDGGLVSMNITQNGSTVTGTNISATGFQIRLDSDCSLQYVDVAAGGTLSGTLAGSTLTYSASLPLVQFGSPFLWSGTATFNGINNTLTGTIQAYGTTGSFTLVRH